MHNPRLELGVYTASNRQVLLCHRNYDRACEHTEKFPLGVAGFFRLDHHNIPPSRKTLRMEHLLHCWNLPI